MLHTADYSKIDSMINAWARKHCLHIRTKYKDFEVRSVDVVGSFGKLYQLWVDPPDEAKVVGVHAWDYKKRKSDVEASLTDLDDKLEEVYASIMSWDEDFSKELKSKQ